MSILCIVQIDQTTHTWTFMTQFTITFHRYNVYGQVILCQSGKVPLSAYPALQCRNWWCPVRGRGPAGGSPPGRPARADRCLAGRAPAAPSPPGRSPAPPPCPGTALAPDTAPAPDAAPAPDTDPAPGMAPSQGKHYSGNICFHCCLCSRTGSRAGSRHSSIGSRSSCSRSWLSGGDFASGGPRPVADGNIRIMKNIDCAGEIFSHRQILYKKQ